MAEKQYVTFQIGNDLFGIDILLVREINRNLDITRVDLSSRYVKGLLNLRGQIVTVLDLRERLGFGPSTASTAASCVVLKTSAELDRSHIREQVTETTVADVVGLLVDAIGDVVHANTAEVEPPSSHNSGVSARFIEGVLKLDDRLLLLLKVSEVLDVEPEGKFAALAGA